MSLQPKLRQAPSLAGGLVAVLGVIVLVGWVFDLPFLKSLGRGQAVTSVSAATCLVLLGASLWLVPRGNAGRAAAATAGVALLISTLGLFDALLKVNLGLDALLDRFGSRASEPLAHMALQTGAALIASALSLFLLALPRQPDRPRRPAAIWLATTSLAIAGTSLLAHLFNVERTLEFVGPTSVAVPTAVALLILGSGIIVSQRDDQLIRMLFARTAAGVLARRLLLAVLVVPILLSALLILLLEYELLSISDGAAILTSAYILSGLAIAFFSAETAVRIDTRRADAEQSRAQLTARLQEQAAQLQETVATRTRELREVNASLRAAADANARLALVASHTTNGVVITDAEGRIEWVNSAFERTCGYSLAELKGHKPGELLQGENTDPAAVAQLRHAVQAGVHCSVEILNYAKDGHPYWQIIDIEPVRDPFDRLINFISVQTDVTEQRQSQERLQALNQRLQLATRSAALGVWEWDPATELHSWDERTLEIYGLRAGEFAGRTADWAKCLHPDDAPRTIARFQDVLAGSNDYDLEHRIVRQSDTRVRYVESRAIVQRDGQGNLLRITGTSRDITEERSQEEHLHALNNRLQLALRASGYGVWDWDCTNDTLVWDERMFAVYGLSRATFDGSYSKWLKMVHPDDLSRAQQRIDEAMRLGWEDFDNEFRVILPDGSVHHIEAHGYIRRDAQGRPIRVVGLDRDVTAEKQMHEALRVAEERWQLAIEGSNDAVWDWNVQTGVVYRDGRWARMLGYEPAEVGPSLDERRRLIHPDDAEDCDRAVEAHLAQRTAFYQHEHRLRAKNGEWRWVLDRGKVVSRGSNGRALRMVGTQADITERKRLEQRLRQVEELASQVSQLAQIGGWELDVESSRLTWSDGVYRIHEVAEDFQPTLAGSYDFYPIEAREAIKAAFRDAIEKAQPFDLELPMITAKSRNIWVRVLGRAEFRNGRAVRMQGAVQDITSRHESEESRHHLEMQLFQAQKMETLGTLAGGIAHDFNNLLTGIMGYHELAADSVPEDHPARLCLIEARNASLRARELVEQILTFGRQSAGEEHTPIDVALVVEEARRFLRATIPATISIETKIAPNCPRAQADATQLHQVLLNLGTNGAHAMRSEGGTILISLQPAEIDSVRATALGGVATGGYLRLSVSDSGHGMDAGTMRRIFDPFFTTKNTREGTGLGLAVVHGIVRAHRGAIDVESTVGVGSTFHIYLPVATQAPEEGMIELTPSPRGAGESVCVVDDEEIVGSFTKIALETKGFRAFAFESAEQFLAAWKEDPSICSVLVTDQTMPGMTGTELAAAVRERVPGLPLVIMSGYFSKISPQALDQLGRIELLAKPFTTDELAKVVDRALHPENALSG